jgi:hemerythrin-like domain-containing protein
MTLTEILKHEHQIILKVLNRVDQLARPGSVLDPVELAEIVDFIRTFADRCHHGKEEDLLFARMAERGFSTEFGPLAVMLADHDAGRSHVKAVAAALEASQAGAPLAGDAVRRNLAAYSDLLRGHIYKEDNILYAMADAHLTPEDQQELAEAFEKVEAAMGPGTHEKYHALAHRLAADAPPPANPDPIRAEGVHACDSFCH